MDERCLCLWAGGYRGDGIKGLPDRQLHEIGSEMFVSARFLPLHPIQALNAPCLEDGLDCPSRDREVDNTGGHNGGGQSDEADDQCCQHNESRIVAQTTHRFIVKQNNLRRVIDKSEGILFFSPRKGRKKQPQQRWQRRVLKICRQENIG